MEEKVRMGPECEGIEWSLQGVSKAGKEDDGGY